MPSTPPHLLVLAAGLACAPVACLEDGQPPVEPPAVTAVAPAEQSPAAQQAVAIHTAAAEATPPPATPPAEAPPAATGIHGLLASEPTAAMKRTKGYLLNHKDRIGVYFGLPAGWRNDDPSFLSAYPRDSKAGGRFVAIRLSQPGLGSANQERVLRRGPKATMLVDPSWQQWQDGLAGRKGWAARIALGSGKALVRSHGKLSAIAAVVDVPGAKAVGIMGTWPEARPDLEAVLADMVRHLHRCHVEVGRGCVPEP